MAVISGTSSLANSNRPLVDDLKTIARFATLGAAAGGIGGLLVGGIGGRIAMFILRVTTAPSIRGLESDDGFTMGRFDVTATLSLFFVTMFLGSLFGLFVVAGRPFFGYRWMPLAWGGAGAAVGGAALLHSDGLDFTLLEPHLLAVAMFIAIPCLGAALIAFLVDRLEPVWWRKRTPTGIGAVALIPGLLFPPVGLGAIVGGAASLLTMRVERLHGFQEWLPARIAAGTTFAVVTVAGAIFLMKDLREIL